MGAPATDWANDGLFGDGWHLFGIGSAAYGEASDDYTAASEAINAFAGIDTGDEEFDADAALEELKAFQPTEDTATVDVEDEETLAINEMTAYYLSLIHISYRGRNRHFTPLTTVKMWSSTFQKSNL